MIVEGLAIHNWNQFKSIEFQFHPRLTVIVGENGSGKTTLLQILKKLVDDSRKVTPDSGEHIEKIGNITLTDKREFFISLSSHSLYAHPAVQIYGTLPLKPLKGMFIPSYQCHLSQLTKDLAKLKEDPDMLEAFNIALSEVFPKWFGFSFVTVEKDSIVFITKGGLKDIGSLSSGINYLICLTWYIFSMQYSSEKGPYLVLVDELEAHLHAALQRSILPKLVKTFPAVQFIVSTHSPHVLSSVRDSSIYSLIYDDDYLVSSKRMEFGQKKTSVTDILRDVLGVSATYPVWVEEELTKITNRYQGKELDQHVYRAIKEDFQKAGLMSLFPQLMNRLHGGEQN